MRTLERSTQAITADPDGISLAQQTGGAADLTITGAGASGGAAVLSPPRRVSMNSAGNIAAVIFTVYGTDRAGSPITDTITGINNTTVATNKIFATVTRIAASAAVGSDVTAGWGAEHTSAWVFLGNQRRDYAVGYELDVTGTVNVDVERTFRNILRDRIDGDYTTGITDFISAKTADEAGALTPIPVAVRLVQNSGSGSAVLRLVPTASP
jgi:hypothetical protein